MISEDISQPLCLGVRSSHLPEALCPGLKPHLV